LSWDLALASRVKLHGHWRHLAPAATLPTLSARGAGQPTDEREHGTGPTQTPEIKGENQPQDGLAQAASIVVTDEPFHTRAPTRSGLSVNQKTLEKPRTKAKPKTQRPPLWKVILLNDDYTPREFVVLVLKAVFRMNESHAYKVMMTAHQRGACVIAVYTRDVAETKAKEATEMGRIKGYPLYFTTEKEE